MQEQDHEVEEGARGATQNYVPIYTFHYGKTFIHHSDVYLIYLPGPVDSIGAPKSTF